MVNEDIKILKLYGGCQNSNYLSDLVKKKKKLHFLTFLTLKKTQKTKNPSTQTSME